VLRQHLGPRPPDSRTLGHATPGALDDLVLRLLQIDPAERYQSAAAAAADVEAISGALERGVADSAAIVIGLSDRRATLAHPALVGRCEETAAFEEHFAEACAGRGGLVLIEAPAGGGKTRLLAELAARAHAQHARVFHGYGVEQAPPLPFQVL